MNPSSACAMHRVEGGERLRHERALRTGVDVLDHRILLRRVEVRRPDDDAPDVGCAVASLRDERLQARASPACSERADVAALDLRDQRAVARQRAARTTGAMSMRE